MPTIWNQIKGFEPLSLCDWPGRATCVIFLAGCELRCPTCHNADLAWRPEWLPTLDADEILNSITRRADWLDGVVITGGEPTQQPDLPALARAISAIGPQVKIDTNGMQPDMVETMLCAGVAAAFSVDVKGPWKKYPELTGGQVSPRRARENLGRVFDLARLMPHAFMFRLTRVPSLSEYDIHIAREQLPTGFTLATQEYVKPRRTHAQTDTQTRRMPGDLVNGSYRQRDPQGPQGQRH